MGSTNAETVLRELFSEFDGVEIAVEYLDTGHSADLRFAATFPSTDEITFLVEVRKNLTPKTAVRLFPQMWHADDAADGVPLLYCPRVTPRVATLAKENGVSWIDSSGNCQIHSQAPFLAIMREGRDDYDKTPTNVTPFAGKSSRIVRAILTEPHRSWNGSELAAHPNVNVSTALVSRIRKKLIDEAYLTERRRRLHVCDASGLLSAWSDHYEGHRGSFALYSTGDAEEIRSKLSEWCSDHRMRCALSGFSAAWQLAPEVRQRATTAYVQPFERLESLLPELETVHNIKRVESGANLILWEPYDEMVFADSVFSDSEPISSTSPIQTWLDVQRLTGRGEEAAGRIYDAYLRDAFLSTVEDENEQGS